MEFPDLVRVCATYMRVRPRREVVRVPRMFVVLQLPVLPPPPGPSIFDAPTERYPLGVPPA